MTLVCYWCGHRDVQLGKKCPGCEVQLEIHTPYRFRSPLNDLYALALKDIILREDARVLEALTRFSEDVQSPA